MMWWALWCAALVAGCASASAPDSLAPPELMQLDGPAPDDENLGYAVQTMDAHYSAPWLYLLADLPRDSQVSGIEEERPRRSFSVNPAMEVLQRNAIINYVSRMAQDNRNILDKVGKRASSGNTERSREMRELRGRPKRKMPSLSINNPMEVLRQRLLLEVARKQMREASQRQAVANRLFLQNVGKRGYWANAAPASYDN